MTPLRTPFALLVLCLALAACGGGTSAAVGTWNISLDETMTAAQKMMDERMASMPEDQKAMMKTMIQPMLDQMKNMKAVMEIKADNTFVVDSTDPEGKTSKVNGTWKMEGDKISMTGKEEGKEKEETIVGTLTGDKIVCEFGAGEETMTMVFNRQS